MCLQSLILLTHLLKHGSERVVTNAREHLYDLRALEHYQYRDEQGKDQGINGRVEEMYVKAMQFYSASPCQGADRVSTR